jgi:hypothetical protein
MTIIKQKHTNQKMERSDIVNTVDDLFNQYYDPAIEPLTEEEWWGILVKYDDAFNDNDPF